MIDKKYILLFILIPLLACSQYRYVDSLPKGYMYTIKKGEHYYNNDKVYQIL